MPAKTEPDSGEGRPDSHDVKGSNEDFVPPSDGSWVPRGRLDSVLQRIDGLTTALETERSQREVAENRLVSRSELDEAVLDGTMSQDDADRKLDDQLIQRVTQGVTTAITDQGKVDKNETELAKYIELVPALNDSSSDQAARVRNEYAELVNERGLPDASGTMVAALKAVLGPLAVLGTKAPERGGDSYNEQGGGDAAPPNGGDKNKNLVAGLSADRKDYYTQAIHSGAYRDWADVEIELQFAAARA